VYDEDICIHCQHYWRAGHGDDCPQVTGVYPVTASEKGIICGSCHGDLGTHYTTVEDVITCIGCAAGAHLLNGASNG
jgi:hypothetical protein